MMDEHEYVYEGQLDVYECIEIAQTGSDGHPTTTQLNDPSNHRIIFTGGRDFHDWEVVSLLIKALPKNVTVVVGDAKGADYMVRKFAKDERLKLEVHEAKWKVYGSPQAAHIRNQAMVDGGAYMCVAFPGGAGTADTVRRAKKAGIRVKEVLP